MKTGISPVYRRDFQAKGSGSFKGVSILVILLLSYSLFPGICSAESPERPNVYRQEKKDTPTKVLRMAIPDFKKEGGDPRYDFLERALPELLAVGLIENEKVEYVDRGEFWGPEKSRYDL
jgi:hypothetical protein